MGKEYRDMIIKIVVLLVYGRGYLNNIGVI